MIYAISDLSRCNGNGSEEYVDAMHRAMRQAIGTPNRGLTLAPTAVWDGNPNFEFTIHETAEASINHTKIQGKVWVDTRFFLNNAPISKKSKVQG
jgi:hypothetical protein